MSDLGPVSGLLGLMGILASMLSNRWPAFGYAAALFFVGAAAALYPSPRLVAEIISTVYALTAGMALMFTFLKRADEREDREVREVVQWPGRSE